MKDGVRCQDPRAVCRSPQEGQSLGLFSGEHGTYCLLALCCDGRGTGQEAATGRGGEREVSESIYTP